MRAKYVTTWSTNSFPYVIQLKNTSFTLVSTFVISVLYMYNLLANIGRMN